MQLLTLTLHHLCWVALGSSLQLCDRFQSNRMSESKSQRWGALGHCMAMVLQCQGRPGLMCWVSCRTKQGWRRSGPVLVGIIALTQTSPQGGLLSIKITIRRHAIPCLPFSSCLADVGVFLFLLSFLSYIVLFFSFFFPSNVDCSICLFITHS